MKRSAVDRLLPLMKARTQLAKIGFEGLARQRNELLQQAAMLRAQAMKPSSEGEPDTNVCALAHGDKRAARLLAIAKADRSKAQGLADAVSARRKTVETALQRETALEEIVKNLDEEDRKSKNHREETQHELIRTLRSLEKPAPER